MALRDLVKPVSPEFATDREIQGDQVDLKINDLRRDLWAVCDAIEGMIGGGSTAGGDLAGTYPNPMVAKIRSILVDTTPPVLGDALVFDGTKYIPSAIGPTSPPLISYFTVNGTWTPDPAAKRHTLMLVGGGGGGGSGRRGVAAMNFGGNGGEGGAYTEIDVLASEVSGAFDVVVGTGGTGGAAVSTDDTDGNTGTDGNTSYIWKSGLGTFLSIAGFGRGGQGGTTAFPTQVYNSAIGTFNGGGGGLGGTTGYAPFNADLLGRAAGGGGGAGGHDGVTDQAGARGAVPVSRPGVQSTAGTAGGGNGTNGAAPLFPLGPGGGGGGGGSSVTTAGGAGGNGSNGGGGGGGGASINGFNSGKGGDGAAGWVRIITYYN